MESWSNSSYQIDLFAKETAFYNRIVLGSLLPDNAWSPLPHVLQSWLRNFIGGTLLYLLSASLWCLYIYRIKRSVSKVPSNKAMVKQVSAAMKGMPWYTLLPTVTEYVVEKGYTKCYPAINDVGWISYLMYTSIYLVLVEFAVYWSHRVLHDVKPLYKHLHSIHHMYNKQSTLSPFAGLAFHPADGVLGAMPHGMALFVVPMHFRTHIALFFVEAIWTANIHDCIDGKVWPVMGAGYHSIHHTTYRHNYGHYTVCMDWMFGTLRYPAAAAIDEKEDESKKLL